MRIVKKQRHKKTLKRKLASTPLEKLKRNEDSQTLRTISSEVKLRFFKYKEDIFPSNSE